MGEKSVGENTKHMWVQEHMGEKHMGEKSVGEKTYG